jgi:hypothetical protein
MGGDVMGMNKEVEKREGKKKSFAKIEFLNQFYGG